MRYTPFAGLTQLDENDPITLDGGSFMVRNPKITDQLLRVGAVAHRHDQHAALVNPHVGLTGQTIASGGTLGASANYALTYTVTDKVGGETTGAPALVLTTGSQIGPPTIAPQLALVTSAGILPAGNYYYALTYTDGEGGETTLGPQAMITIVPGFASASVLVSGIAAELGHANGPVQWRLWRSYEGEDWHLAAQGSQNSYDDAGFDPPDNPARPPSTNNTASTWSLLVTLPTVAQEPALASGTAINLYIAPDTNFNDPCFYAQLPLASAGHTIQITREIISPGSPPHVSTSIPGAGRIYPDTDMVWALRSPVPRADLLPSGVIGDVRVALDSQHIFAVLQSRALTPLDWTDLSAGAAGGITVMGSGVGDAIWQVVAHESFGASGASAQISHFANVASGAVLAVTNGLLTTNDPTQTDALIGPTGLWRLFDEDFLSGPFSQALSQQTWNSVFGGVQGIQGYAQWGQPGDTSGHRSPDYNVVASWSAAGVNSLGAATPVPTFVSPTYGSNQIGDVLWVNVSTATYCTFFWWNGSAWAPLYVDATTGIGYTSGTPNWVMVEFRRAAVTHETIYGYRWSTPGQLADGYKLRAHFHGLNHPSVNGEDNHAVFGLAMNLVSGTSGLVFYVGPNFEGWTTRPQDIIFDQNNWPPTAQQQDDAVKRQRTDVGMDFNPLAAGLGAYFEDLWVEVWRTGNIAYAALYSQDPAGAGVAPFKTYRYNCAGTPYAAGNAGYFGVVANHIADQNVGVAELTVLTPTVLPTLTLYNEHEIIFTGSGGINVGVQRAASGIAQVVISGGGIEVAGSGGVGAVGPEQYVEFVGSGGTGVAIQSMGGGSARVLISAPAGGGGGSGIAGIEVAGAGATPVADPTTSTLFDGSTGNVALGNVASLKPATTLTVEAWVKPSSFSTNPVIMANTDTGAATGWFFQVTSSGLLQFGTGAGGLHTVSGLPTNAWSHVVVTYNAGVTALYVNGVAQTTAGGGVGSSTSYTSTVPYIGQYKTGGAGDNFAGNMEYVAFYSAALTAAQVSAHYSAVNYRAAVLAESSLVSLWTLGEASGTTASDLGPAANNGTYGGGFTLGQAGAPVTTTGTASAIGPESYIQFVGSGGTGVAVTDLGGGSARVLISGSGMQGPAGPAGAGAVALGGSAGVNPAPFGPETYIEFAGSGGTGVAVQNTGGGSARVLISAPAGGGNNPSVFENDTQQAVSLTNASGFTALATPDRVTVTTASASDEVMVRYDALWTCDQGVSAQAAIFVDGVQCTMITPNNATPQVQQAVFAGGVGFWVPLYTAPMELATAGPTNVGLVSQTSVATPTGNTDNPFPGSTIVPGGPIILRGLAPGAHTIEVRFNSTYSGTQNVYAKRRHLRAWVT